MKVIDFYFKTSKENGEVDRVDTMGERFGLTQLIDNNVLISFNKAERRLEYAWIYNLVFYLIRKWNGVLNKLKIEVK